MSGVCDASSHSKVEVFASSLTAHPVFFSLGGGGVAFVYNRQRHLLFPSKSVNILVCDATSTLEFVCRNCRM